MSDIGIAPAIALDPVSGAVDLEEVRTLFVEYARSLGFSLCFQGFDRELATLPGLYAPPAGRLLLARVDGAVAGTVGLRPLGGGICEMKRLFVRPAFRGHGLGRRLAEAVVDAGRALGYRAMRLDTLRRMTEAIALYRTMGFVPIPAYNDSPDEVIHFEKRYAG